MGNCMKGLCYNQGEALVSKKENRLVTPSTIIPDGASHRDNPNRKYAGNKVKTTKYTLLSFLPKNLFEQFHRFANIYFVFIVVLNWVPAINAVAKEVAMLPVIFVLAVTALKDGFEDFRRYRMDKKINHRSCKIYSKSGNCYVPADWQTVKVGDIVKLYCNEVIPADIILFHSTDVSNICHIDTSNIDGESNLKQREVVRKFNKDYPFKPEEYKSYVECDFPNPEINHFKGNLINDGDMRTPVTRENLLLRGCIIRNTDSVEGIVVYAGHETKAMLNNRGPRYKRSKLERMINKDVVWCAVILFLMCLGCALGSGLFLTYFDDPKAVYFIPYDNDNEYDPGFTGFLKFWTYIILFQVMIPLSLYVTIEIVKLGQVYFITNDVDLYDPISDRQVECRALNITEDLGQIEYIFSDKTGTLTENKMVFRRCAIQGNDFTPDAVMPTKDLGNGVLAMDSMNDSIDVDNNDTIYTNSLLKTAVSMMTLDSIGSGSMETTKFIHEFFFLLAVCNTVVVSPKSHKKKTEVAEDHDDLKFDNPLSDQSDKSPTNEGEKSVPKHLRHRVRSKATPYGTFEGKKNGTIPNGDAGSSPPTSPSNNRSSFSLEENHDELLECYEAESPDELALVKAAHKYGVKLISRSPDGVRVYLPGQGIQYFRILHILHFDSTRKRMSVVVKHPDTGEIIAYTKGADSAIIPRLKHISDDDSKNQSILHDTQEFLNAYAKDGLRTLVMTRRILSPDEYATWLTQQTMAEESIDNREKLLKESAKALEKELELLGVTGIEDRLQEGVPETIDSLRRAGINVWVLTGDKQETALNIAYSCQLISYEQDIIVLNAKSEERTKELIKQNLRHMSEMGRIVVDSVGTGDLTARDPSQAASDDLLKTPNVGFSSSDHKDDLALVIDGITLAYALRPGLIDDFLRLTTFCSSVLCCRAAPFQKAAVVKMVRDKSKKMTLAIGDGANDVSMIQTADIGVGISGQEGMQAVMASDFALPRFRFLKRMMLVHGHWSYDRLARMTLYMFYKNAVFVIMLMWFQIYTGFSGSVFVDDLNLIGFNLFWTSLPPIAFGIMDQCCPDHILMKMPHLYKRGIKSQVYRPYSYFLEILDASWQSLVEFFIPYWVYSFSDVGLWEFGTTANAACVYVTFLHVGLETHHWNLVHVTILMFSLFTFVLLNIVFDAICVACAPPFGIYYVWQQTLATGTHWFCLLLIFILALAPRYLLRTYCGTFCPNVCEKARQIDRWGYSPSYAFRKKPKVKTCEGQENKGYVKSSRSSSISSSSSCDIVRTDLASQPTSDVSGEALCTEMYSHSPYAHDDSYSTHF